MPTVTVNSIDELAESIRSGSVNKVTVRQGVLGREHVDRLRTLQGIADNKGVQINFDAQDLQEITRERDDRRFADTAKDRLLQPSDERIVSAPAWTRDCLIALVMANNDPYQAGYWLNTIPALARAIESIGEPCEIATLKKYIEDPAALWDSSRLTGVARTEVERYIAPPYRNNIAKMMSPLYAALGWRYE
jgi:hypothetical protein